MTQSDKIINKNDTAGHPLLKGYYLVGEPQSYLSQLNASYFHDLVNCANFDLQVLIHI